MPKPYIHLLFHSTLGTYGLLMSTANGNFLVNAKTAERCSYCSVARTGATLCLQSFYGTVCLLPSFDDECSYCHSCSVLSLPQRELDAITAIVALLSEDAPRKSITAT